MNELSLALRQFNEKVRAMNQSNAKQLTLTAQEARNIHTDLFSMLSNLAALAGNAPSNQEVTQITMDGGSFRQ